ncbi:MAG: hypothetical protein OXG40_11275 [Acidimicrobiaceae bacterium]|nr:hypothetical protein [Acidimicrobiaceae bacterium]MDE0515041.1 hypothetical protein [Acidimicrobiaceae bacterium]
MTPLLADGVGPVRYLGLPGADLLDIRWMLSGLCEQYGRDLLFVGFDTDRTDGTCRSSIEAAKLKMELRVDSRSQIVETAFESLAEDDSFASEQARRLGAFDLVNVDLCNGMAGEAPTASGPTMYNAIASLLGLQAKRIHPWILLITTRIDRRNVDAEAGRKLANVLAHNMTHCPIFSDEFHQHFGFNQVTVRSLKMKRADIVAKVRSVAIAKWIISLAADKEMEADLVSAISYTVYPKNGHPDLLSLAFKIEAPEPSPALDRFSIAQTPKGSRSSQTKPSHECDSALTALRIVHSAIDADQLLRSDPELMAQTTHESADLLESAGYPRSEYASWARRNPWNAQ